MRKLAVLVCCLVIAAMAVPAMAASKIDFEGKLIVLHHNLYNFNRASEKDYAQSDSFFESRLHFGVDFKPNDDVLVHWSFRAPDYVRWGVATQGNSNAAEVYTRAIYATITQDWGALSIGRLEEEFPTSHQGLATLGYSYGGDYIYTLPFDNSSVVDGISYTKKFDNGFGINVYYAKDETQDPNADTPNRYKDVDKDRFGVEPFYQWTDGGVAINFEYVRDMTDEYDYDNNPPTLEDERVKDYAFFINPAVTQTWGAFSVRFEGKIGWGEATWRDVNDNVKYKEKQEGLGFYLEGNYNYGAGDINLMAWYADGSNVDERYDETGKKTTHDLVNMGDFAPFLVAYYGNTLPNRVSSYNDFSAWGAGSAMVYLQDDRGILGDGSNHWGIGILGNHSFTDKIKVNYGLGFFRLVEPYWTKKWVRKEFGVEVPTQDKNLGVEIDLGVHIDLIDNVSFESQFGYMFNGKAYKNLEIKNDRLVFEDPKDTFAWVSALTVSF